jgi:transcriptional regulator with XRE-family HTH domain
MAARRTALATTRKAAGHTQESLAGSLSIDRKTVIRWESGESAPWPYLWPKLARLLGVTSAELQVLLSGADARSAVGSVGSPDYVLEWLDTAAGWPPGTARSRVTACLGKLDADRLRQRNAKRARVGRSQLVQALTAYYCDKLAGFSLYGRNVDGHMVTTSVLTRPDWLDLRCSLAAGGGQLVLATTDDETAVARQLDSAATRAAVQRLAEAVALGVRLTDAQLYRLLTVEPCPGAVTGNLASVSFVDYALTADLLEGELLDRASPGAKVAGSLPLRDRYLPDLASVVELDSRPCVGGVLSLCAIARPADADRPADYALLVQRRSDQVLNAPGRLAVIPKGFHQPLVDRRTDVQLSATLRRELEEELFARSEVDNTLGENRVADPMHPTRLSAPMRWLDESGTMRMECTGFGLNLVSGNYEFACLTVIEDDEFWRRFGGHVEANWEASGLRMYSSLDRGGIADLAADESWSNEGLFAFLQGLDRLAELGGQRVNLPGIDATAAMATGW